MDEGINIAELELDGRTHVVETNDLGKFGNDAESAIQLPPMVVGHFQNEEFLENVVYQRLSIYWVGQWLIHKMFNRSSNRSRWK